MLSCVDKEMKASSQWVNLSLKISRDLVKIFKLQDEVKVLKWPAYDPDFVPAVQDGRLNFSTLCQTCGLGK